MICYHGGMSEPIPASPLPPFGAGQLLCGSRTIRYTLRPSARARNVSLLIRPDAGLVVTVPLWYAAGQLPHVLRRHERWIVTQLDRLAAAALPIPRRWPYGSTLPYQGQEHLVVIEAATGRSTVTRTAGQRLAVRLPRPSLEGARRLLKRWYVGEATRHLLERATALGSALGIGWARLRVRDQRGRWGSCSARGHLSFNYRLIMASAAVMDYVVVHELMHRRELSHAPRFWALVAAVCPTYRESVTWLKTYGPYLSL